ncbi:TlpA family protein disulfide reductase [Aestuariibaculum sediminum]|uniref:TlpA family protein disulfide reductase n=1 Tax=Aestuariibaculum sediminum TaxID=2770637 RepID=A0A8J6UD18_9FLAO|nr:TlpA disulfide reductase family protein [Aestuariibaculum sediminum]MBD0832574.1 TlpA family protein disulfide reductase [Aestuariibaculum sediminum]
MNKNIKRVALLCLMLMLSFFVFQCHSAKEISKTVNDKTFTLTADLKGLDKAFLVYFEKNNAYPDGVRRDTIWVKDGKFTFTDSVNDYKLYFLNVLNTRSWETEYNGRKYTSSTKADVNRLWFIAYPGAEIKCSGKVEEYMVDASLSDGRGVNQDFTRIQEKTFPLIDRAHALRFITYTEDLTEEESKKLSDSANALFKQAIDLKKEFAKSNPKSIAASYVFMDGYYRKYFTHDEAKAVLEGFDTETLDGTPFYDEVNQRIAAVENTKLGMQAPEVVTNNTLDGSEFKLSNFKGNYVLLDYWGTWCGPCMAEIPKIKEYYQKYSDKNFVVVGVNSGDAVPKWKKTVEDNGYNWEHIQTTSENNLLVPFNVTSFPTKILIDPAGKIIYSSNNATKTDMYAMLDAIFKKG